MSTIDSNAFERWFGGSKVVDANGKPLVVYHGTKDTFNVFESSAQKNGWIGKGFYFTEDKSLAKSFGRIIISAYLRIESPFVVIGQSPSDVLSEIKVKYPDVNEFNISEVLNRKGYDGIYFRHWDQGGMYTAFKPAQIKSATSNNRRFDPINPDIYQ